MFPSCFFCFVLRLILLHVYSQVQKLSLKPAKLYDLTDGTLRGLHKMLNLWFFLLILTMIPLNSKALTEEKKQLRYFGLPPSDPFCTCQQCSVTPQRNVTACAGQLCTHWWHLARFLSDFPLLSSLCLKRQQAMPPKTSCSSPYTCISETVKQRAVVIPYLPNTSQAPLPGDTFGSCLIPGGKLLGSRGCFPAHSRGGKDSPLPNATVSWVWPALCPGFQWVFEVSCTAF